MALNVSVQFRNGGNKYIVTDDIGEFNVNRPLIFNAGDSYTFNHPTDQHHPMFLSTSLDRNNSNAIVYRYSNGTVFNPGFGLFENDTSNKVLYMHCVFHANMHTELLSAVRIQVCFAPGTQIETSSGLQNIETLTRGTMIKTLSGFKPLARLMISEPSTKQEFVKFTKGCTQSGAPLEDLYCTRPHPLVLNFKLVAAELFVGKVDGVEIVVSEQNQYNLLFETQEYLYIHGLLFVSHHPNHPVNALSIDEYFDQLKYRPGVFFEQLWKYEDVFN
jgi:hypothetical protein